MGSGHYTEKEIKAMVLRGPMAENSVLAPILYTTDDTGDIPLSLIHISSESGEAVGDAVSNPAAPAPPENQEDPIVGNDMESDGLTNEEAGLD